MRFVRFNLVGALGIVVQIAVIWLLVATAPLAIEAATAVGVAAAVVHNFVWHRRWTWADRGAAREPVARSFLKFACANGLVSLAGNVLVMALLARTTQLPVALANLIAIAVCGLANYWLADVAVFAINRRAISTKGT